MKQTAKLAKKDVIRECVSCKKKAPRENFLRVLRDHKNTELVINPDNKRFGKSFYLCKTTECISKLSKNKKFKSISGEIIEEIKEKTNN